MTEMGLEEGTMGSSVVLGHPPYFSCDSALQLLLFHTFPCCYRPILPALFPVMYSLAPSFSSPVSKGMRFLLVYMPQWEVLYHHLDSFPSSVCHEYGLYIHVGFISYF